MTFVNESCFTTVPSCTVSGFLSGIHTVMTFALKKQKRLCRRTVLCGQQTEFTSAEENSLVMTFVSESCFATMLWSKHFATQNGLLSKFCYAKPPIQNFASQSGLRPPHHGHDFRKRKLPLATAPSCAVSRSKHFATQNGLRPPRFLRGAYLHGQQFQGF